MSELQTDSSGNIVTKPVTGWAIHRVAGIAVLLAIEYADTPEELEKGANKRMQFVLNAPKTLELAEALTRAANGIMSDPIPQGTPLN